MCTLLSWGRSGTKLHCGKSINFVDVFGWCGQCSARKQWALSCHFWRHDTSLHIKLLAMTVAFVRGLLVMISNWRCLLCSAHKHSHQILIALSNYGVCWNLNVSYKNVHQITCSIYELFLNFWHQIPGNILRVLAELVLAVLWLHSGSTSY